MKKITTSDQELKKYCRQFNKKYKAPLCIVSQDGLILESNNALTSLLNYNVVLAERKIYEIMPSVSIISWRELWETTNETDKEFSESILMNVDGNLIESKYWRRKFLTENKEELILVVYPQEKEKKLKEKNSAISNLEAEILTHSIDQVGDMIFWINKAGELVYFNFALSRMMGYTYEQLKTMKAWEFSPSITNESEWIEFFEKVEHNNGSYTFITEQFRVDGEINYIETTNSYINFGGQEYIFSSVRDITKRKEFENQLSLMKHSLDQANEIIVYTDEEGNIFFANETAYQLLDYNQEELHKKEIHEILPQIDKDAWEEIWNATINNSKNSIQSQVCCKDGREFPASIFNSYIDLDGKQFIISIIHDISERTEIEKLSEKMRLSIDNGFDIVFWINESGDIVYVNEKASEITGFSKQELLDKKLWEFSQKVTKENFEEIVLGKFNDTSSTALFETQIYLKDGSLIDIELSGTNLLYENERIIIHSARDITEKKAEKEKLKLLKHSLDQANEMIIYADFDGNIFYTNQSFLDHINYSREELYKTPITDLFNQLEISDWEKLWNDRKNKIEFDFESTLATANGKQIPIKVSTTYIDAHKKQFLIFVIKDLSEKIEEIRLRKQMEISLEYSFEMVLWNTEDGDIVYANQKISEITGFSNEELLSKKVWDISARITQENFQKLVVQAINDDEKIEPYYSKLYLKNGATVDVQISGASFLYRNKRYFITILRDVTQELKKNESLILLKNSLDEANEMILHVDQEGNIIYANNTTIKNSLYNDKELINLKIYNLTKDVDEQQWAKVWEKSKEKHNNKFESLAIRKDGTSFPINVSYSYTNVDGKELLLYVAKDISEEIKKSDFAKKMLSSIDYAQEMIFWTNTDGDIIYVNKRMEIVSGYRQEELLSMKIWDISETLTPNNFKEIVIDGFVDGIRKEFYTKIKIKSGRILDIKLAGSSFTDRGERVIISALQDVTEELKTENLAIKMKRSVDNANELIFWANFKGEIVYVNKKIIEVSGYSEAELLQLKIWDLSATLTEDKFEEEVLNKYENGVRSEFTRKMVLKDGNTIDVRIATYLFSDNDEELIISSLQDITDELQAENLALKMKRSVDNAFELIFWTNIKGDIVYVNNRMIETTGYSEEELLNMKLWDISETLTKDNFKERVLEEYKEGVRNKFNRKLRLKNGEIIDVRIATYLFTDNDEQIIITSLQDLTEENKRKRLAVQMKRSFDNAFELIVWIDADGNITYNNKRMEDKTGFSKEDLHSMKIWDLAVQMNEEKFHKLIQSEFEEGEVKESRSEIITKDGRTIHTIISGSSSKDDLDHRIFICAFKDVTEELLSEQLIKQMKIAVDSSFDLIFWSDENGNIIYANERMVQVTGLELRHILTKKLWEIAKVTTDANFETYKQDLLKNENHVFESFIPLKNGQFLDVEFSASAFKDEKREYYIHTARDISERKQYEKELQLKISELKDTQLKLEDERTYLKETIYDDHSVDEIITQNKEYKKVLAAIPQVADTSATVLIYGETGTGKELIARAVHNLSPRAEHTMVKINCAAIPASLIESELFGHKKGAFTGAYQDKAGRFKIADKGTIFLDEIGEMPMELQSKLLRVLQEGEFEAVGSVVTEKVDVRVIAATNRDLLERVEEGEFREDLYYRLNVFPIQNMPLRDRKDDIPPLVDYFLDRYAKKLERVKPKVNQASIKKLQEYDFPGNIRELENMVERALILSKGNVLDFTGIIPTNQTTKISGAFLSFDEMQKQHIIQALEKRNWKITGKNSASELLKMNGKTLASKIKKYNIQRND